MCSFKCIWPHFHIVHIMSNFPRYMICYFTDSVHVIVWHSELNFNHPSIIDRISFVFRVTGGDKLGNIWNSCRCELLLYCKENVGASVTWRHDLRFVLVFMSSLLLHLCLVSVVLLFIPTGPSSLCLSCFSALLIAHFSPVSLSQSWSKSCLLFIFS